MVCGLEGLHALSVEDLGYGFVAAAHVEEGA